MRAVDLIPYISLLSSWPNLSAVSNMTQMVNVLEKLGIGTLEALTTVSSEVGVVVVIVWDLR